MEIIREGKRVTVLTDRRIDTYSAPQFAETMEKALAGTEDLTLDFSDLDYISSSGLRVVMRAVKAMNRQGQMRIVNVGADIYDILETTGFTGICDIERKP